MKKTESDAKTYWIVKVQDFFVDCVSCTGPDDHPTKEGMELSTYIAHTFSKKAYAIQVACWVKGKVIEV